MNDASLPAPDASARKNLRWLFVLRNLMISTNALIFLISIYGLDIPLHEPPLWGVIACLILFNWVTWVRLDAAYPVSEAELFVQLTFDVLAITAILYFTGGATNPIAWFFLFPLIIAATVLPQSYTWYMVILASACYTVLMGYYVPLPEVRPALPSSGFPPAMQVMMMEHHSLELHVFGMWFGFVFSAVLVAYFVVEMANTLRERDRKLAEARERVLRNERLVALGTLAAGAAHEIGTPLGTMAILIHELEQEFAGAESKELHDRMQILREQISRCKQALSVMSASAGEIRADAGHAMPVARYLDEVVRQWSQQRPEATLNYHKDGAEPMPSILAERSLTHALVNILNNAADASPSHIELKARWSESELKIEILDRGPGVAPGLSERLGKTPVSTKSHGLGVGLFLAYATIEQLNGKIEMIPQSEAGTCTRILLPLLPR
jgi:two-component system sensor histidine kinase RegB